MWGKQLHDGAWVDLILFADNYWLVATDHKMLGAMTVAWLRLLGDYGWETPMQELTWCTTAEDDGLPVVNIDKKETKRTMAQEGFKVLGIVVTFDNEFEVELEHRLTRSDRVFWANWELLGCISIPLERDSGCLTRR